MRSPPPPPRAVSLAPRRRIVSAFFDPFTRFALPDPEKTLASAITLVASTAISAAIATNPIRGTPACIAFPSLPGIVRYWRFFPGVDPQRRCRYLHKFPRDCAASGGTLGMLQVFSHCGAQVMRRDCRYIRLPQLFHYVTGNGPCRTDWSKNCRKLSRCRCRRATSGRVSPCSEGCCGSTSLAPSLG